VRGGKRVEVGEDKFLEGDKRGEGERERRGHQQ